MLVVVLVVVVAVAVTLAGRVMPTEERFGSPPQAAGRRIGL